MDYEILLKHFLQKCKGDGVCERTQSNTKHRLSLFFKWCGDREINTQLILDYLDYIDDYTFKRQGKTKKYSDSTKYQQKVALHKFIKWHLPNIENPITLKAPKRKLPDALIDENDIEKLIKACYHPRDAALIAFLYESGCRKGEMLGLVIKSVHFDELGAVVTFPESKTGSRRIKVIWATSYLRTWIESHPRKDNPENPLFCSLRTPDTRLSEVGLHNQLKDIAARADIKKKLYPHLLRHSRATILAKHLTEQEMKTYLGWTQSSEMASVYVHLAGEDIDNSIMHMYGLEIPVRKEGELKVISCPRCKRAIPASSSFCSTCGIPLTETMEKQLETEEVDLEGDLLEVLSSDKELAAKLLEMLNKLKK